MISLQTKRLYQSAIILLLAAVFVFLSSANPVIINNHDFCIYNTNWNGCSNLAIRTYKTGQFQPTLSYNHSSFEPIQQSFIDYQLNPIDSSLFIIGPKTEFSSSEINYVHNYVSNGGTLLLADDFGSANSLLTGLNTSTRFSTKLLLDLSFEKNASFVAISNFHNQSNILSENLSFVLSNYPTILRLSKQAVLLASSSEVSWLDTTVNGKMDADEQKGPFPVLAVESYGDGKIMFCSTPSVFINNMRSVGDNNRFRTEIMNYLLNGKNRVIIDESHRDLLVPFQMGYAFSTSLSVFYKIAILLLAVILFVYLFTPLPQHVIKKISKMLWKNAEADQSYSSQEIEKIILQKHPDWDKKKISLIIKRMNTK